MEKGWWDEPHIQQCWALGSCSPPRCTAAALALPPPELMTEHEPQPHGARGPDAIQLRTSVMPKQFRAWISDPDSIIAPLLWVPILAGGHCSTVALFDTSIPIHTVWAAPCTPGLS